MSLPLQQNPPQAGGAPDLGRILNQGVQVASDAADVLAKTDPAKLAAVADKLLTNISAGRLPTTFTEIDGYMKDIRNADPRLTDLVQNVTNFFNTSTEAVNSLAANAPGAPQSVKSFTADYAKVVGSFNGFVKEYNEFLTARQAHENSPSAATTANMALQGFQAKTAWEGFRKDFDAFEKALPSHAIVVGSDVVKEAAGVAGKILKGLGIP